MIPPVIYHYCSVNSFMKIIENRCIFASIHTSLNDFTEASWFYNILKKEAESESTSDEPVYNPDIELLHRQTYHLV